jgi:gamma-glutamyl:cysteine ligase YbdK (ATP-grasp superfamily)
VHRPVRDDILLTLAELTDHARELDAVEPMLRIERRARDGANDARWRRERYAASQSFEDPVWNQAEPWRGRFSA